MYTTVDQTLLLPLGRQTSEPEKEWTESWESYNTLKKFRKAFSNRSQGRTYCWSLCFICLPHYLWCFIEVLHTCKHQTDKTSSTIITARAQYDSSGYWQRSGANKKAPKQSYSSLADYHLNQVQLGCQRPKPKHMFCIFVSLLLALISFSRLGSGDSDDVMLLPKISLKWLHKISGIPAIFCEPDK